MRQFLIACTLMITQMASALGPFPDGIYEGELNCWGQDGKNQILRQELILKGNLLDFKTFQGGSVEINSKKFTVSKHGFLTFTSKDGTGDGYCGSRSCHWDAVLMGMPGEDTLTLSGDQIILSGSVTFQGAKYACEAVYSPK